MDFTEDDIRRSDLPSDVFGILHDLAWSHVWQASWKWEQMITRAQDALKRQPGSYHVHAVALGRLGGQASKGKTSERKAVSSRENGKKGGRPRKENKQG